MFIEAATKQLNADVKGLNKKIENDLNGPCMNKIASTSKGQPLGQPVTESLPLKNLHQPPPTRCQPSPTPVEQPRPQQSQTGQQSQAKHSEGQQETVGQPLPTPPGNTGQPLPTNHSEGQQENCDQHSPNHFAQHHSPLHNHTGQPLPTNHSKG